MPSNTVGMIYLGRLVEVDRDETNTTSENASAIIDIYKGAEQLKPIEVTNHDQNGNNVIEDDDRPFVNGTQKAETADFVTYTIDGVAYSQKADSTVLYNARVVEANGMSWDLRIAVVQMQNGDTFAVDLDDSGYYDGKTIKSVELLSVQNANYTGYSTRHSVSNTSVVCFLSHTRIKTPCGTRSVGSIRSGDLVVTLDHGAVPVLWAGACSAAGADVIEIEPGALGPGVPARRLSVSRQHRVLSSGPLAQRMFGTPEILLPAYRLLGLPGVRARMGRPGESFVHVLLDRHAILLAEETPAESLLPGVQAIAALRPSARRDMLNRLRIAGLLPSRYRTVRKIPSGARLRSYVDRLARNAHPVIDAEPVPA